MKTDNLELNRKISENLGDLIEGILLKKPPFIDIPIHEESAKAFQKYCEYENDLDEQLKTDLIKRDALKIQG